jgi:hypothetical protein
VLYKFQIAGAADHVWAVLQMPGPKYKVYQSYNMGEHPSFSIVIAADQFLTGSKWLFPVSSTCKFNG